MRTGCLACYRQEGPVSVVLFQPSVTSRQLDFIHAMLAISSDSFRTADRALAHARQVRPGVEFPLQMQFEGITEF